jgi:NDP-hexose-3-ketoreductase
MKWGVLGCANIAQRSVIPAILAITGNRLVAVASRSADKARTVAGKFGCVPVAGYAELLKREDIEAVYVPLPTGLHHEWVIKALEADKHVLVEKSAAVTLQEAEAMVAKAREKKRALVENFQFVHHAQHRHVRELLEGGAIGDLRCFRSAFGFPPFEQDSNIRYQANLGGGALLDAGAYVLRATTFLCGPGLEVAAAHLEHHGDYGVDWYGGAFLRSPRAGTFSEVAFGFENYYQCNYELWGSTGRIVSTRAFTAKPDFSPTIIVERSGHSEQIALPPDDHFLNMIRHFQGIVARSDLEAEWTQLLEQARLISDVRRLAARAAGPG